MRRDKVSVDYDQMRLYELIWKHHCFTNDDAKLERTVLKINTDQHQETFTAHGRRKSLLLKTFKVYLEGVDDDEEEAQGILPPVSEGG